MLAADILGWKALLYIINNCYRFHPKLIQDSLVFFPNRLYILFIDIKERKGERERRRSICCSTYLCFHWLILVCAQTGDQSAILAHQDALTNRATRPGPKEAISINQSDEWNCTSERKVNFIARLSIVHEVLDQAVEPDILATVGTVVFSSGFGRHSCNTFLDRTAFPLFQFSSGFMRGSRFPSHLCYDCLPGSNTLI